MANYEEAVSSLLYKFQKGGFSIDAVYDGLQSEALRYLNNRDARKAAVDIVCSVDESSVRVKCPNTDQYASLFIVLGNEKCEILCDYSAPQELMPLLEFIADEFANQWEGKK
jgi:hypothetical protein